MALSGGVTQQQRGPPSLSNLKPLDRKPKRKSFPLHLQPNRTLKMSSKPSIASVNEKIVAFKVETTKSIQHRLNKQVRRLHIERGFGNGIRRQKMQHHQFLRHSPNWQGWDFVEQDEGENKMIPVENFEDIKPYPTTNVIKDIKAKNKDRKRRTKKESPPPISQAEEGRLLEGMDEF